MLCEIRVGVFADDEGAGAVGDAFARLLGRRGVPYALNLAGPEEPNVLGEMTVGEFYEELAEQWGIEHPGADPGSRRAHEVAVGVLASGAAAEALSDELTRVLCPEPEHSSPCPVPWSVGCSAGDEEDADELVRLARRYGHLRGSAAARAGVEFSG